MLSRESPAPFSHFSQHLQPSWHLLKEKRCVPNSETLQILTVMVIIGWLVIV